MSSAILKARSQLGVASRSGDAEAQAAARRSLAAAKLAAYIERIVSEAPPLDAATRDRLALLLHGGDAA